MYINNVYKSYSTDLLFFKVKTKTKNKACI